MLKLTRTYNDYNGASRTEDFYFNLTQAEVTEMELSVDGGLVEMINRIVAAQDGKQIIAVFKDVILRAYGDLFMELATDAEAAARFINGIIPQGKKSQAPSSSPAPQN